MSSKTKLPKLKVLHQQLGKQAEKLAANYLQKQGFCIVGCNYRYKKAEIDLIAQKKDCLVFVEVKARTSHRFGYPEDFVVTAKEQLIREAAENYLIEQDWHQAIRFDIIAILNQGGKLEIRHFEDAFW